MDEQHAPDGPDGAPGAPGSAAAWTPTALQALRVGFIGAGRLARALSLALRSAGIPVVRVASRSEASARTLAEPLPDCRIGDPPDVARDCDLVFLTSPAGLIAEIARTVPWRAGRQVQFARRGGLDGIDRVSPALAARIRALRA